MVLLLKKVMDLEIHLNNPKQKQGNGRDSLLLPLNIEKKVEEAQQKTNASLSYNGLGWKGPYRSSSPKPPAMGRDIFH